METCRLFIEADQQKTMFSTGTLRRWPENVRRVTHDRSRLQQNPWSMAEGMQDTNSTRIDSVRRLPLPPYGAPHRLLETSTRLLGSNEIPDHLSLPDRLCPHVVKLGDPAVEVTLGVFVLVVFADVALARSAVGGVATLGASSSKRKPQIRRTLNGQGCAWV